MAYCPEWLGCHAQGNTPAEALKNIVEVIDAFAAIKKERGEEPAASDSISCYPRSRELSHDSTLTHSADRDISD